MCQCPQKQLIIASLAVVIARQVLITKAAFPFQSLTVATDFLGFPQGFNFSEQSHFKFTVHTHVITLSHPVSQSTTHSPSTQANMGHETVWYSRPRTYGKGSRQWYILTHVWC